MKIETYLTRQINYNTFSFYSIGPNGRIELRIIFSKDDREERANLYNLAFGEWNEVLNDIDDTAQTRNGDMDQILSTVAHAALSFMKSHPKSLLYTQGSNSIRTRKYQMGISKYINEIPPNLGILGLSYRSSKDGNTNSWEWEYFRIGNNYHAFLLYSK